MPKDVFFCHNSKEKAEVEKIREQLLQKGIDAWLDKYDFKPFQRWQDQLKEIIPKIKAVAVFIGSSGVGPWADIEMQEFLVEFANNHKLRIGLVILPGCPDRLINTVPGFLKHFHWVDFRLQNPDPMEQLIWGITGQKPKTPATTLSKSEKYQKLSGRRQFLKWVGWGILGLVTSVVGREIWSQRDRPTPNTPIPPITPSNIPTPIPPITPPGSQKFPISKVERGQVADGVHMDTSVNLSENGKLNGSAHTWTNNKFQGAHAKATIIILDSNQTQISIAATTQCGVAGKLESDPSNRTCYINETVPSDILKKAAYISIVQTSS